MRVRKDIIEEGISKRRLYLSTSDSVSYYFDALKPAVLIVGLMIPFGLYLAGPLLVLVITFAIVLMGLIVFAMRKGLALQVLNIVVSPEDFHATAVAFQKEFGGMVDQLEEDIFVISNLKSANFGASILTIIRTNKQLFVNCRAEKGFFNLANLNKMGHYVDFFNTLATTISGSAIISEQKESNDVGINKKHLTILDMLDKTSHTLERIFIYPLMLLFISAPLTLMYVGEMQIALVLFVVFMPLWLLFYKYVSLHLKERKQLKPNRFD